MSDDIQGDPLLALADELQRGGAEVETGSSRIGGSLVHHGAVLPVDGGFLAQ